MLLFVYLSLCGKNRRCAKKASHSGACDKRRSFHKFWASSPVLSKIEVGKLKIQAHNLETQNTALNESKLQKGIYI